MLHRPETIEERWDTSKTLQAGPESLSLKKIPMPPLASSQAWEHQSRLLRLPKELLLAIFKSQSSLRDVSQLSQTCHLLHAISDYNARAIADAIEPPLALFRDEVMGLAEAQLLNNQRGDSNFFYEHHVQTALCAAQAIANRTSSLPFITDDALRLAEAQLAFTSPTAVYCPVDDEIAQRLLEQRLAEAQLTPPSNGPFTYFAVRHRASQNVADSTRVLVILATTVLPEARVEGTLCKIHPRDMLLAHEQARVLSAWYFLKLYVLSYHLPRDGLRRELDAQLNEMTIAQLYIFYRIRWILCDDMDDRAMVALGIEDLSSDRPPDGLGRRTLYEDWEDCRHRLMDQHILVEEADEAAADAVLDLVVAFCDYCDGEGHCKPRQKGQGIWDISVSAGDIDS